MKVCSIPGCPTLVRKAGKCSEHRAQAERERGSRQQRGYDSEHERIRASWQRILDSGKPITCWRPGCGKPIDPSNWHLGHDDHDRTKYRGPECVPCNTATASRRP
jgi:hypothetical protein